MSNLSKIYHMKNKAQNKRKEHTKVSQNKSKMEKIQDEKDRQQRESVMHLPSSVTT